MSVRFLIDATLALLCSIVLAFIVSPFVTEAPFPHDSSIEARAEVMKKTSRNIYGSEDVVIDEAFYVTVQYPVHDGGVERVQATVTEAFYDTVEKGDILALTYNPDQTDHLWFDGRKEPMSRYLWAFILTICALPPFFLAIAVFRP